MAKGYGTSGDILTRTRDGQDLNNIWTSFQQALEAFNATRTPLVDLLSFRVTNIIEDLIQPAQERFEKASEFGIPQSIRPVPVVTQRAYPFDWWDMRAGYTFQFLAGGPSQTAGASTAQIDAIMNSVMEADNQLEFDMVMKALFNNANRTANVDQVAGATPYTVTALYNADGSYIPPYKGQTFAGSHNHYLATGSAQAWIFDPQDFIDAATTLEHHGYNRSNGFNVLFLLNPTDAAATIQRFVRNTVFSTSTVTSLYDFIPAQGQNMTLQLAPGMTLVGGLPSNAFAGLEVLGSWGPYLVIQDNQIPSGYFVAVATSGQSVNTNVVGIREHANASLRGLVLRPGNNQNYPLIDSFYIRGIGSGIGPRGAAAIMQNAAAYAVPAAMAW